MLYATVSGQRSQARPHLTGQCPQCLSTVHAKCGEIRRWHFAHERADCDAWGEGETAWHLDWKAQFPSSWVERTIGPHRADIQLPNGRVIEVQRSSISPREIREREQFYGNMLWIIDASPFCQNITLYERSGYSDQPLVQFKWAWKHECWKNARYPVLLDFSDGLPQDAAFEEPRLLSLAKVGKFGFGEGRLCGKQELISYLTHERPEPFSATHTGPLLEEDTFFALRREHRLAELSLSQTYEARFAPSH